MKRIVQNGTKVIMDDGCVGIVDGNDAETCEKFEDISYYVCPIEFTNMEVWSNYYIMLMRSEFNIVKER